MSTHIYAVLAVPRTVLAHFGTGERALERALDYAARCYALSQYLAIRDGFPPTASPAVVLIARSGRPLTRGQSIDRYFGALSTPDGYRNISRRPLIAEVACVAGWAAERAVRAVQARYPWVWQHYLRAGSVP